MKTNLGLFPATCEMPETAPCHDLLRDSLNRPVLIVVEAGQSPMMLSDPLRPSIAPETAIEALHTAARQKQQKYLTPCLYKCGVRTAEAAVQAEWWATPVADEAVIDPHRFNLDVPARRQLRKAETAGVEVAGVGVCLPLDEMRTVAQAWATHRGTPRGSSMGRFEEDYVYSQRVWLAYCDQHLVAFATLHEAQHKRALDMMCHTAGSSAGTMHLLVTHAIRSARNEVCPRVSLAAAPRNLADRLPVPSALVARIARMTGAAGLIRFKPSFVPDWEPLYICAPGPVELAIAGIDIVDHIVRPSDIAT